MQLASVETESVVYELLQCRFIDFWQRFNGFIERCELLVYFGQLLLVVNSRYVAEA